MAWNDFPFEKHHRFFLEDSADQSSTHSVCAWCVISRVCRVPVGETVLCEAKAAEASWGECSGSAVDRWLPHLLRSPQLSFPIPLSLLAWPPSWCNGCSSFCLFMSSSFFCCLKRTYRRTRCTYVHSHMCTEPLSPSLPAACLSCQLLGWKNERWNTSACSCCRWSTCILRTSLLRTPSCAQETSSYCKTLWESSVNLALVQTKGGHF